MPAIMTNGLHALLLELKRDKHPRWAVKHGISSDETACLRLDSEKHGGVQPCRILPKLVEEPVLISVFNLEATFVCGPVSCEHARDGEQVKESAHPLAVGRLKYNLEWS